MVDGLGDGLVVVRSERLGSVVDLGRPPHQGREIGCWVSVRRVVPDQPLEAAQVGGLGAVGDVGLVHARRISTRTRTPGYSLDRHREHPSQGHLVLPLKSHPS
jgi:hypothetical protein